MLQSSHLMPTMKRWIVLTHLYLGVAFSALFVMWFASGVVLMYSPYPAITAEQRQHALPLLDCTRCVVSALDALQVAAIDTDATSARTMRLGMLGSRPVWRIRDAHRTWHVVYADSLAAVRPIDAVTGAAVAMQFARRHDRALPPDARVVYAGTLTETDQWTLEQPIPSQLPLLQYDVSDHVGTRLYVSAAGAEVVTGTTRRGRALAWIGAIPHWIYPTILRRHVREWSVLVTWLAALGTIMSVTGVAVGLWQWRWRTRRPRDGRIRARSPYRDVMMRWHHVAGLLFGAVTCTWIFSGMMSMNPGEWSPGAEPSEALLAGWARPGTMRGLIGNRPAFEWRTLRETGVAVRELGVAALGDQPYWVGIDSAGIGTIVRPDSGGATVVRLRSADVVANARRALQGATLRDSATLTRFDDYYRATDGRTPPLPVLRLRFDDRARTWLYVEPGTGRLRASFEARSRLERWLYSGLHDLDVGWLYASRPAWDVVVVLLSIGGLVASFTGLVVGIRWLRVALGAGRAVRRR